MARFLAFTRAGAVGFIDWLDFTEIESNRRPRNLGRAIRPAAEPFCLLLSLRTPTRLGCLPSSVREAILVATIALVLGSTVTASDNARDWPYFEGPQQYLINNLGEVLRDQHALESCSQQQQEALQRFLNMGISYNAAALMAHSQYPCDSTDQ